MYFHRSVQIHVLLHITFCQNQFPYLHLPASLQMLHDIRHTVDCFLTENIRISRDFSPAKELQPFLFYDNFKHLLGLISLQFILWEEKHTDTVFSFLSQFNSKSFTAFLKNLCDICNRIPTPSPVFPSASLPALCSKFQQYLMHQKPSDVS